MATAGTLAVNIIANLAPFSRDMKQARRTLTGFGSSVLKTSTLLIGMATAAAGVGVVGGFGEMIRSAEQFDQAMQNSTAIMGELSGSMRRDMVAAANEVALSTKFSATQAAEAYFFLASAGLDATQSMAAMPQVAAFAQAGNFDLALATDLLTDAQSALGMSSRDAAENLTNLTRVSDVLVKGNTLANASVQQFSEALTNKAGAALRIVHKDVEEGVAVLAAFADQGIKGAEAGTGLGIVMRDLQTKAIQNAATFREFGVTVFDSSGSMQNMAAIIGDLETALAGMSDEQAKLTLATLGFSDKSVAFVQTLLGTSSKIRDYEAALRGAGGATADIANKQMTPLQKATNLLRTNFDLLSQNIATVVTPTLVSLIESVSTIVGWMANFDVSTAKTIVQIAAFSAALLFALKIIPMIVTGIRTIVVALRTMTIAQAVAQAMEGPTGWATLAASMAIAAGAAYAVGTAFNGLTDTMAETSVEAKKAVDAAKSIEPPPTHSDKLAEFKTLLGEDAAAMDTLAVSTSKAAEELEAAKETIERIRGLGALDVSTTAGYTAMIQLRQARADAASAASSTPAASAGSFDKVVRSTEEGTAATRDADAARAKEHKEQLAALTTIAKNSGKPGPTVVVGRI